jgi:hypothetical protein
MRLLEMCVIVMILGVLGALLVPGSSFDLTHRFLPTATDSRDEFSSVAGEYYQGAARGRYFHLSILADGRYSFIWSEPLESGWEVIVARVVGEDKHP